jgi:uncharacterized membrane protein YfhO
MTLNATFITILILSGYGLKSFINAVSEKDTKIVASVFAVGLSIIGLVFITYDSFAYATANEASQYDANTLNLLKGVRKELLLIDLKRLLMLMVITSGLILAFLLKKINKTVITVSILILAFFEIFYVSNRAHSLIQLSNKEQLEKSVYKETPITKVLKQDQTAMRGIVIGNRDFTSNHYAYFYPLISGYSAIKLQLIQDVIAHNLFKGNSPNGINWNIINMLSGKYIISPAQLQDTFLSYITQDDEKKHVLYQNNNALSKAWFVKKIKKMKSPEEVVLFMNTHEFKPDSIALVVNSDLNETYSAFGSVNLVDHNPNYIEFDINANGDQFLVVSEVYYPEGWIAKLDDEEIKIHQVNHVIRGVSIRDGNHKLTFEFRPATYYSSLTFLWIGNFIILGLILIPWILTLIKGRNR